VSKADKRERQKENRERAREERERLLRRERQVKTFRSLLFVLVPIMVILIVVSLTSGSDDAKAKSVPPAWATIATSAGTMVAKLDTTNAPVASKRFIALAKKGYYDGLCFDRLSPDFVIQGGSPKCDQQGGEGHPVKGEVPKDHYPLGSLAAAKTGSDAPGTFDSQFFIVTGSKGATLPNDYARFGSLVSGVDVAQAIEKLPVQPGTEKPVDKITITKVTIGKKAPAGTTSTTAAATPSST
jgi:cyclophilin family peptidyl-prolyl cis-trans isomerase